MWQRERTYYGVTNERIIIISGFFTQIKSLNLRTLTDVSLDQKVNGCGTITFGPSNPLWWWYRFSWPGMGASASPCFESIKESKAVYDLIRDAQKNA